MFHNVIVRANYEVSLIYRFISSKVSLSYRFISSEVSLIYRFISRDLRLVVAMMGAIAFRFGVSDLTKLFQAFIFVLGFVCHYDISNQLISVEEDRINKPERPLPAKLCTVDEAENKYLFFVGVHLVISFLLGQGGWALLGIVAGWFLMNGGDRHWITKNILGGTLTSATVIGGVCSSLGIYDMNNYYVMSISLWMGFGLVVELFRDHEGDTKAGRVTLIQQIGESATRKVCLIYFGVCIPCFLQLSILQIVFHWLLALHIYWFRGTLHDKHSYYGLCVLFIVLLSTF